MLNQLIASVTPNRFVAVNLFVDLFLCTLFMYFLNYRPKKVFTGKKVIIFRLFAILPIAYEAVCMLIKAKIIRGEMTIPVIFFPLLTVKPPMTFVEFMVMAAFIKTREYRFCRHGRTHEEYQEFLTTNRNSLHFAVFTSVTMLFFGVLDYLIIRGLIDAGSAGLVRTNAEDIIKHNALVDFYFGIGLGDGAYMAFIAPVVLLFSYTRQPKFKQYLSFIPVAGIALILLIALQSGYQIVHVADVPKIGMKLFGNEALEFIKEMQ